MISEIKNIKTRRGEPMRVVEVKPDNNESRVKVSIFQSEMNCSVCPMVSYYSKTKQAWVNEREYFRANQWMEIMELAPEVERAIKQLAGEDDWKPKMFHEREPMNKVPATSDRMPFGNDDDEIPF